MIAVRRSWIGTIPPWIDPERSGWPFRVAATIFAQPELYRRVKVENLRNPSNDSVILPNARDYPKPQTRSEWWSDQDIHTPILLDQLIRGEAVAFGDPDKSGACPEWIAPRQWADLTSSPESPWRFEGGGRSYWNVRVMTADDLEQMRQVGEQATAPAVEAEPKQDRGGRHVSASVFAFFGEVVRLANSPDGLPEEDRGLAAHMRKWVAATYEDGGVSDGTIASWLKQAGLK